MKLNKLNQLITQNLHVVQDNIQLIDYTKLFEKKIKQLNNVTITSEVLNTNVTAEVLNKLGNLRNNTNSQLKVSDNGVVQFFGGFEGSNILYAEMTDNEANILLNADTNSNGCTHWFYFGVQSTIDMEIKFKVLNNRRTGSLCSKTNHIHSRERGDKWRPSTYSCFYYKTNINHPFYHSNNPQTAYIQQNMELYTLEFCVTLKGGVYTQLALNVPYTVSDLNQCLNSLEDKSVSVKVIGRTPLDHPLYKLTFKPSQRITESVVIMARQHPSESGGSHLCDALLRQLFRGYNLPFKLVVFPMVNPDGVYIGNSRCNYNGVDLNRKWDIMDNQLAPEVVLVKQHIKKLHSKYPVQFAIDLHGHSQQLNSSVYGCMRDGTSSLYEYLAAKLFSRMLERECKYFVYSQSRFRITKDKQSTARVVLYKELNIQNSLTIETSYFGYVQEQHNILYTTEHYNQMTGAILRCIGQYKQKLRPYGHSISVSREDLIKKSNRVLNSEIEQLFPQSELIMVQQIISRGMEVLQGEQLPDSDSEAEWDLSQLKAKNPARRVSKRETLYDKFLDSTPLTETKKTKFRHKPVKFRSQLLSCEEMFPMRPVERKSASVYIAAPGQLVYHIHNRTQVQYTQGSEDVSFTNNFPLYQRRNCPITEAFIRKIKSRGSSIQKQVLLKVKTQVGLGSNQTQLKDGFRISKFIFEHQNKNADIRNMSNYQYQRSQKFFERSSHQQKSSSVSQSHQDKQELNSQTYANMRTRKIDPHSSLSKVIQTIQLKHIKY